MTNLPILSGVSSLAQLEQLLPIAYQHRTVGHDAFVEGALQKARTFDANICDSHIRSLISVDDAKPKSPPPPGQSSVANWASDINQNHAWIEENASIYRLDYGDFIEPAKFKTQFDNQTVSIVSGGSSRLIGKGTAWLKDPIRRQHRALVIRPSEGQVTPNNCLNEWQGFAVKPVELSVQPFLDLLARLVPAPSARHYALSWLAHLVQHPDIKMHVSLAFWSLEQGVGKNLLFEPVASVIGNAHATVIGQTDLTGSFNSWANRRVFVIGDEVSSTNRRQEADKLKGLITGPMVRINEKYQPAREVPNLMNFVFLSNHYDILFVDDRDRRFFVWEITAGRLPDSIAQEFVAWRDSGGLSALLHFLQNYDFGEFNPKAPAPMTDAKQQMVQDNRSDLETWLADLMASEIIVIVGREVVTGHELARRYDLDTVRRNTSAKAVVGACKRLGAYARTNQVRLANGKKVRALAIARPDYWAKQAESVWADELMKPFKF